MQLQVGFGNREKQFRGGYQRRSSRRGETIPKLPPLDFHLRNSRTTRTSIPLSVQPVEIGFSARTLLKPLTTEGVQSRFDRQRDGGFSSRRLSLLLRVALAASRDAPWFCEDHPRQNVGNDVGGRKMSLRQFIVLATVICGLTGGLFCYLLSVGCKCTFPHGIQARLRCR